MSAEKNFHTAPRLWTPEPLSAGKEFALPQDQAHYLCHVLRLGTGDNLRLFDGRSGEWLAQITGIQKKSATIIVQQNLRLQPPSPTPRHLVFSPIRKERMDFLIEKSVELGATDLHPVLTERSAVRAINEDRLRRQIVEAAEQCERLDIPTLHALRPLPVCLAGLPEDCTILACIERSSAPFPDVLSGPCAFVIGPEGGFTENEREGLLKNPAIRPVSLGTNILRAETAALCALSISIASLPSSPKASA